MQHMKYDKKILRKIKMEKQSAKKKKKIPKLFKYSLSILDWNESKEDAAWLSCRLLQVEGGRNESIS